MSNAIGFHGHYPQGHPADVPRSGEARGARFQSAESASLRVKTDDGDTVRISFVAMSRIEADAQTAAGESAMAVRVDVKGTLDDAETAQIGELLQRLAASARSGEPQAVDMGGFESLDRFRFVYREASVIDLLY